jgi:hypothetical protein
MKRTIPIWLAILASGCTTHQLVNPFSRFGPADVQRIEICYTHDLAPGQYGMEGNGPFSDAALPTYESYLIPITGTNLIARLYEAVVSVSLSPLESEQFGSSRSLCEQVFIAYDGRVLAIVSAGSRAPTIEVIEGFRRGGSVSGGRGKREHGFRGAATNSTYHALLSEYLVGQVQTEWFMDVNNPGLRLRNAVLKEEARQRSPGFGQPVDGLPKPSR